MATHINDRTLKIISNSYNSLFPPRDSPEKLTTDKKIKIPDKKTLERIHKQIFSGGVRAPTLADLSTGFSRYPSRQEKLDSPLRFHLPSKNTIIGASRASFQKLEMEKSNLTLGSLGSYPRIMKFLLPNGSTKASEGDSSSKSTNDEEKDEWEKWRESVAGVRDARDVLYRYSFSRDSKVRYNCSTLPHIPKEHRPWTAGEDAQPKIRKNNLVLDFSKDSKSDKTHVPQPHRQLAIGRTLRRKLFKNRGENPPDVNFLEVKRITVSHDSGQYTTNVQQPFEFHGIGFSRNRTERPLKNEAVQGRPVYHTWNKHYVQVPAIPAVSIVPNKDYKSVDAYKQYVENFQNNVVIEGQRTSFPREREKSDLSQYGQENRLLQSVINVNQPGDVNDTQDDGDVRFGNDVMEAQTNRSNFSLNKNEETNTNRSNKSIVVEIKATWKEREKVEEHDIQEQCEVPADASQPAEQENRAQEEQPIEGT